MYNWGSFASFSIKKVSATVYTPVPKVLPTPCNLQVIKDSSKKLFAVDKALTDKGEEIPGVYGKYETLDVITSVKSIDWAPCFCTFVDLKGRVWSFG